MTDSATSCLSVGELATRLGITHGQARSTLDGLVDDGLVVREGDSYRLELATALKYGVALRGMYSPAGDDVPDRRRGGFVVHKRWAVRGAALAIEPAQKRRGRRGR